MQLDSKTDLKHYLSQIGLGYVPLFLLGFTRQRWQVVALAEQLYAKPQPDIVIAILP